MESFDCEDQRSDGDHVKKEAALGRTEEKPFCNGRMTEDDFKILGNKKKLNLSESETISGGKRTTKIEDNGKGEVPAHHARRPPNGFLLFCKRHRDIVSSKNPNLENRGVTKLLGNWWRTLEEDERDKYKELARQNKEIFIANNPQFTWYKLPAPPLRTLVTRPSNRRPPKLEPTPISGTGPITPGKLADESQLGGLTSLLSSSLSPPTTPLNSSPPLPTESGVPAPPKKRFLFQTRAQHSAEEAEYHSESDEAIDASEKKSFCAAKKKYKKKKKNYNSFKYKKNLKLKWKGSLSNKIFLDNIKDGAFKSNNNCTKQHFIEKIVDSSFDAQKSFQDNEIQRALDYINTEHTYQKNPRRFVHQQQHSLQKQARNEKKKNCFSLHMKGKSEESEGNLISPNLNNNTIILSAVGPDKKGNFSYSFNDNNNLIVNYTGSNQRKVDQLTNLTNHDRINRNDDEDGYIPGGNNVCIDKTLEDCDTSVRSEDQKKPLKVAQVDKKYCELLSKDEVKDEKEEKNLEEVKKKENDDEESGKLEDNKNSYNNKDERDDHDFDDESDDHGADLKEMPKNCDSINADFQSILGKVSREIVSMMKERDSQDEECMAVARFNLRSKSETDSEDGSWYYKSDESLLESPEGRRSKRSCKGQRYEQFIKDSVSKKRSKNANTYLGTGETEKSENRKKRKKNEKSETSERRQQSASPLNLPEFLLKEREFAEKTTDAHVSFPAFTERLNRMDLIVNSTTKASDIIQLKLDLERSAKKCGMDEKLGRKDKESKKPLKKKPLSKVQMIKEKREIHVGEFNLNEKIEELPLLSFESFLQKKRQRKKRLLGLKKEGGKNKIMRNRLEKIQNKSLRKESSQDRDQVSGFVSDPSQTSPSFKPDFADLTTLAETALTLLSLREPR